MSPFSQGNVQCEPTTISWQGSNPPYTIGIVQNQTSSQNPSLPQVIYRNFSQNSLTFRLFYPEGTNLLISVAQEDSSVKYSPLVDGLAVAAGTNADCLMQATAVRSQTPVGNSASTDIPQCGSLQANVSGSVIYINSNAQYTDKNLIATSPSTIMYRIGKGNPATFNINIPYPAGTPLFFQSGDLSGGLKTSVNIESRGNNSCLLADPPSNSTTTPIPTSNNPQDDGNNKAGTIIPAIVVPVVALLLAGIVTIFFFRRRRDQQRRFRDSQSISYHDPQTSQIPVPHNSNQYNQASPAHQTHGLTFEPFRYNHSRSDSFQSSNVSSTLLGDSSDITGKSGKPRLAFDRQTESDSYSDSQDGRYGESSVGSPGSVSDLSSSDRMRYVRHHNAVPYRVTELPPLYQDLTTSDNAMGMERSR
ncbi:hypothetical protein K435DRAFT_962624 [Dendrothele bispora CBS 962.96]|uniref:Uncharacterized protein n=1 Tax=Dendrothele bispora (strain CBS 962.96) TaxID=1314807 RepID=A0A4S8MLJ8_DENBC|nr:hypothetical protein K435DRAFT_962624 [Dendrothele bispora CBS 962.96]